MGFLLYRKFHGSRNSNSAHVSKNHSGAYCVKVPQDPMWGPVCVCAAYSWQLVERFISQCSLGQALRREAPTDWGESLFPHPYFHISSHRIHPHAPQILSPSQGGDTLHIYPSVRAAKVIRLSQQWIRTDAWTGVGTPPGQNVSEGPQTVQGFLRRQHHHRGEKIYFVQLLCQLFISTKSS